MKYGTEVIVKRGFYKGIEGEVKGKLFGGLFYWISTNSILSCHYNWFWNLEEVRK